MISKMTINNQKTVTLAQPGISMTSKSHRTTPLNSVARKKGKVLNQSIMIVLFMKTRAPGPRGTVWTSQNAMTLASPRSAAAAGRAAPRQPGAQRSGDQPIPAPAAPAPPPGSQGRGCADAPWPAGSASTRPVPASDG